MDIDCVECVVMMMMLDGGDDNDLHLTMTNVGTVLSGNNISPVCSHSNCQSTVNGARSMVNQVDSLGTKP